MQKFPRDLDSVIKLYSKWAWSQCVPASISYVNTPTLFYREREKKKKNKGQERQTVHITYRRSLYYSIKFMELHEIAIIWDTLLLFCTKVAHFYSSAPIGIKKIKFYCPLPIHEALVRSPSNNFMDFPRKESARQIRIFFANMCRIAFSRPEGKKK